MSERSSGVFLKDILFSINKIRKFIKGKSFDDFRRDEMRVDAVVRNLEIIGEAAKQLPLSLKQKHGDVEWKKISGLRDILIHEYYGVDYDILWDIAQNKIPVLKKQLKEILKSEKQNKASKRST